MARKSCISHKARQHIAVIRQDYYELMDRDSVSAAILSIFEYWANGAIAANPSLNNVIPVGERTVKEFEKMLLGISTDKQIRARLKAIEERGFIEASQTTGRAKQYSLDIGKLQSALDNLGQTTEPPGQTTGLPRSNNRFLYIYRRRKYFFLSRRIRKRERERGFDFVSFRTIRTSNPQSICFVVKPKRSSCYEYGGYRGRMFRAARDKKTKS